MKVTSMPLRIMIPLLVFLLVLVFSLLVMSLQYYGDQQNFVANSEHRIRSIMIQSQRHLERFFYEDDQIRAEEEVMTLALVNEIKNASLVDADGDVRFSTSRQWKNESAATVLESYSVNHYLYSVSTLRPYIDIAGAHVYVYFPVVLEASKGRMRSETVGVLYVEWSFQDYFANAKSLLIKNVTIVVVAGIIAILLFSWLLFVVVVNPLKKLHQAVEHARTSRHHIEVEETGANEIASLSRAYNSMQKKMNGALSALRNSEERWLFALDSSGDGVADWDMATNEVFFSHRLRYLLGFKGEDYLGSYDEWRALVHEDDREHTRSELRRYLRGETDVFQMEYRIQSNDGKYRWMFVRGKVVERSQDGRPLRFVSTFTDFTERKNAEEALKSSEEEYRYLFELAQEGIWVVDEHSATTMVNKSMGKMLGYSREEMIGKHMFDFMDERGRIICEENLGKRKEGISEQHDFELITRDGRRIYTNMSTAPIIRNGEYQGSISGVVDITARIEAEEIIRRQANYDPLTDLPNRRMLFDRLEEELARSRRHNYIGAVLFVDLDHFKNINDSLGHPVGDKLLVVIAKRMRDLVRDEDIVARLGGDEFVVLVPELGTDSALASEAARTIAKKLQDVLSSTFMIEGHQLHVSCSIGIALYPQENDTIHDIFRQADAALYRSKEDGRNAIRFFSKDMQVIAEQRMQLQMLLPRALEQRQFFLQYQPQLDEHGTLIGAEALVRWNQPTLGLVRPDQFIAVAEESGLIVPLGDWIAEEACNQLSEWETLGLPFDFNRLAINISPRQFVLDDFAERISSIVRVAGISPNQIELEITEGMLLDNLDVMVKKMKRLKDMGFFLSIDDFGTGYSSLSYLKSLPLSKLKIDQSFIRDIQHDKNDRAIVETIISMAKHLDLDVLAEGVETKEQLKFLVEKGCYKYQGFYFSKPLMPDEFYELWIKPQLASQRAGSLRGPGERPPKH